MRKERERRETETEREREGEREKERDSPCSLSSWYLNPSGQSHFSVHELTLHLQLEAAFFV